MTKPMIKTMVVAEEKLLRECLARALCGDGRFCLVDSLSLRHDVLDSARRNRPQLALIELSHPSAVMTLRGIARVAPGITLIALTPGESEQEIIACAKAGADGYITRDASVDDVIDTILSSLQGELRCSPRIARSLFQHVGRLAPQHNGVPAEGLTRREAEILDLITEGFSNKRIARALGIEVATVKNHVHRILGKLGVACRGEAAAKRRRDVDLAT